jgi:N-acetylglucosaminyldiphosphoundecaprenol N-acetyl-beta-D-mannosaminyltransferase
MRTNACPTTDQVHPAVASRFHLMGSPLDPLTMDQAVRRVEQAMLARRPLRHVAMNAAKLVAMRRDPLLRWSVQTADLVTADGQSIVWASRLLGHRVPERVTGIDLMLAVVALAARRGLRVFTLGAREEVVRDAVAALRRRHPGLNIVGAVDGYFTPEQEAEVVRRVAEARPDVLLVALSTPKKELFLASHQDELRIPFSMGVGGSLDVIAGRVRRAPLAMQRLGLEWFFRLVQEPRRLGPRYLRSNTAFLWMLLREWLRPHGGELHTPRG